jgi:ribosomal protein L37AE/L43A
MKQKLKAYLSGRNGADALSRFESLLSLAFLLVSIILRKQVRGPLSSLLLALSTLCLSLSYFRMASRNLGKRQAENARFLARKRRVTDFLGRKKEQFLQRRFYRFYKCPGCNAIMRVPRGKGRVRIICRKCGDSFEKTT